MTTKGKLFFFCGKMGAGKSTSAKKIARIHSAVLLSEDEWLAAHFPADIHTFDDYITLSNRIKPFIRQHVQSLLCSGVNVVMDFPANTVKQRRWFMSLCSEVESEYTCYFLNVTDEQCLSNIAKRRVEQPERAHFDTESVFHHVTQYFEAPKKDEMINVVTEN